MLSEHILLGDFNLHHPYWGAPSTHPIDYLDRIHAWSRCFACAPSGHHYEGYPKDRIAERTTIDLIFVTDALLNQIIRRGWNHFDFGYVERHAS